MNQTEVNSLLESSVSVCGAKKRIPREGAITPDTVMDEMSRIIGEHPASMEYETDARDTWPKRWNALLEYLKGVRG